MKQRAPVWLSLLSIICSPGCEPHAAPEAGVGAEQGQTEVLHQRWRAAAWQDDARNLISYDSTGLRVENVELRYRDGAWAMAARQTYRYGGGRLLEETLREEWVDGRWRRESREVLRYDDQGRVLESDREVWAWYDEVWFEAGREEHSYAEGLHTTLVQRPTYDGEGYQARVGERPEQEPAWSNSELVTQRLDARGEVLEEVTQRWRGEAWANSTKRVHEYDGERRQTETRFYVWQDTTWTPALRTTYHTHDDGTREAVVERPLGDGWVNATRTLERSH